MQFSNIIWIKNKCTTFFILCLLMTSMPCLHLSTTIAEIWIRTSSFLRQFLNSFLYQNVDYCKIISFILFQNHNPKPTDFGLLALGLWLIWVNNVKHWWNTFLPLLIFHCWPLVYALFILAKRKFPQTTLWIKKIDRKFGTR